MYKFAKYFSEAPKEIEKIIADYVGLGQNGKLIGVTIFGNNEIPTELEFWSVEGNEGIAEISEISTLMPNNKKKNNLILPLTHITKKCRNSTYSRFVSRIYLSATDLRDQSQKNNFYIGICS